MRALTSTYYKGHLKLDSPFKTKKPVKVTVYIQDEGDEPLNLSDFSFNETQELLKDYTFSFSDEVIEERRSAI